MDSTAVKGSRTFLLVARLSFTNQKHLLRFLRTQNAPTPLLNLELPTKVVIHYKFCKFTLPNQGGVTGCSLTNYSFSPSVMFWPQQAKRCSWKRSAEETATTPHSPSSAPSIACVAVVEARQKPRKRALASARCLLSAAFGVCAVQRCENRMVVHQTRRRKLGAVYSGYMDKLAGCYKPEMRAFAGLRC